MGKMKVQGKKLRRGREKGENCITNGLKCFKIVYALKRFNGDFRSKSGCPDKKRGKNIG